VELNKSDIRSSLNKKGFIEEPRPKDHVYFNYQTTDGAGSDISTKISRGSAKSIGDSLIAEMATQCRIKKSDFVALIRCTLDRGQYEKMLREKEEI
jgi:hypothetical protein